LMIRSRLNLWTLVLSQLLAVTNVIIALIGILSHSTGISIGFGWYLAPVLSASLGFLVSGLTLVYLIQKRALGKVSPLGNDSVRIAFAASAIVIGTGICGILGGFAVLYPEAVGELHNGLTQSLKYRGDSLDNLIAQG